MRILDATAYGRDRIFSSPGIPSFLDGGNDIMIYHCKDISADTIDLAPR
jgi:hypothetical protein